ncbi:hypothetical protein SDC9_75999 [bioreactor metagenome]|uniref:Uncharacterized protein n=1 Tax=bioreactor metagenome TaxID=1076179 RepID=A0A644YMC1_9ZZZZ
MAVLFRLSVDMDGTLAEFPQVSVRTAKHCRQIFRFHAFAVSYGFSLQRIPSIVKNDRNQKIFSK